MTVARNSAITSMSVATAERSPQPAACADVFRAGTAMSDGVPLPIAPASMAGVSQSACPEQARASQLGLPNSTATSIADRVVSHCQTDRGPLELLVSLQRLFPNQLGDLAQAA